MRQIRARIRDKRGADYTEAEIRELASVKLEKFLDPRAVRSNLLQHYRSERQPAPLITPDEAHPPLWDFNPQSVYASDRGAAGKILTIIRKILKPFSKLLLPRRYAVGRADEAERAQPPAHGVVPARPPAADHPRRARRAQLRDVQQSRRRDYASRHREQEPAHAGRVVRHAPRLRRAPGARARRRRPVSSRRAGGAPAAASAAVAARAALRGRRR